jgi:APA family basic amino acid/polyamine antiporter
MNRVLGLGFAIALAFGNTIGVGILSLPGQVAQAIANPWWLLAIWIVGGLYALLGAINVAELAAMMPEVGGFYVYARRAFGPRMGFLIGWNDWVLNVVAVAYVLIAATDYLHVLVPSVQTALTQLWLGTFMDGLWSQSAQQWAVMVEALVILGALAALQWIGVGLGSQFQNMLSMLVGLVLVVLGVAGFFISPTDTAALSPQVLPALPVWSSVLIALRLVIVAYDGWYGAIYMAGESTDAQRNVPRAMISCAILVMALYVLINAGFVHALGMSHLAHTSLPAADVAHAFLPHGGDRVVAALSFLTVLSLINAALFGAPRILLAVASDGLQGTSATHVSDSGTPRPALLISVLAVMALVVSGSFARLVAIGGDLFVLNYLTAYSALLWLRLKDPQALRPFKVIGFPVTTAIVWIGSVGFLCAAIWDDGVTAEWAAGLLLWGVAVAFWLRARSIRGVESVQ